MSDETAARRAKYHHGDLRAALIEAGIAMLEEVGPEKLSLRGIAARVGVSHTAPKNHFDGLRGLLTAIAAEGFRRHAAAMTDALPKDAGPQTRLRAAAEGYVRFARDNPALFRLMFNPGLPDLSDPELQKAGAASYAVLQEVADGMSLTALDGSVPGPRQKEMMLWSLVHGFATLTQSGITKDDPGAEEALSVASVMPRIDYGAP